MLVLGLCVCVCVFPGNTSDVKEIEEQKIDLKWAEVNCVRCFDVDVCMFFRIFSVNRKWYFIAMWFSCSISGNYLLLSTCSALTFLGSGSFGRLSTYMHLVDLSLHSTRVFHFISDFPPARTPHKPNSMHLRFGESSVLRTVEAIEIKLIQLL